MTTTVEVRLGTRSLLALAVAAIALVGAALVVATTWRADAAPGDTESTYVPWPGCRLTDTRPDSTIGPRSTPLGADDSFNVAVYGDQGECTGDLAIPSDAVGLATNVTAVQATAQSNIRVYRGDLTEPPLLSNLNVFPGAPPTPNKVDVQLSPDGEITVYNFKGAVHIVIDVVGYYTAQGLQGLSAQSGAPGPQGPAGPAGPSGVVTMQHGFGPTIPAQIASATITPNKSSLRVRTDTGDVAQALEHLDAPMSIAGEQYLLANIDYCVSTLSTKSWVAGYEVWGTPLDGSSPEFIKGDSFVRDEPGCVRLFIDDTEPRRGVVVTFKVDGNSVGSSVSFSSLSSTWEPVS